MTPGARQRLLAATIELVRERGVHGTGIADVLERSGTARGSVYQHFPDGKSALVAEAVRAAGRALVRLTEDARDGAEALEAVLDWWESELTAHGGRLGCPIAAGCVDADPTVVAASAEVLEAVRARLVVLGTDPDVAGVVVSAIEGGVLRARSLGSAEPVRELRGALVPWVRRPPRPGL